MNIFPAKSQMSHLHGLVGAAMGTVDFFAALTLAMGPKNHQPQGYRQNGQNGEGVEKKGPSFF